MNVKKSPTSLRINHEFVGEDDAVEVSLLLQGMFRQYRCGETQQAGYVLYRGKLCLRKKRTGGGVGKGARHTQTNRGELVRNGKPPSNGARHACKLPYARLTRVRHQCNVHNHVPAGGVPVERCSAIAGTNVFWRTATSITNTLYRPPNKPQRATVKVLWLFVVVGTVRQNGDNAAKPGNVVTARCGGGVFTRPRWFTRWWQCQVARPYANKCVASAAPREGNSTGL